MTPKEKAIELFNKYVELLKAIGLLTSPLNKTAKRCAFIAVDEIADHHNDVADFMSSEIGYVMVSDAYWQEVKKEIEKL